MGLAIATERTIARPRAEVARYAMDPANDPRWIGGIREAELLGTPPLRAGMQVRRVAFFLGRRIDYVLEASALVPGEALEMRSVQAPFPMQVNYRFADAKAPDGAGSATRVRIEVSGDPGRFYVVAGPLMAWMVRRNVSQDLKRLARLLEQT